MKKGVDFGQRLFYYLLIDKTREYKMFKFFCLFVIAAYIVVAGLAMYDAPHEMFSKLFLMFTSGCAVTSAAWGFRLAD